SGVQGGAQRPDGRRDADGDRDGGQYETRPRPAPTPVPGPCVAHLTDHVDPGGQIVGEGVEPGGDGVLEVVHASLLGAGALTGSGAGARRARRAASPLATWLLTVLREQPMRRAVSASLRSSKYRRTTAVRTRGESRSSARRIS